MVILYNFWGLFFKMFFKWSQWGGGEWKGEKGETTGLMFWYGWGGGGARTAQGFPPVVDTSSLNRLFASPNWTYFTIGTLIYCLFKIFIILNVAFRLWNIINK